MTDLRALLREVCGDDRAGEDGTDLFETGLLDSMAFIELFTRLEEEGYDLRPTRIDRTRLRTPESIEALLGEHEPPPPPGGTAG